MNLLHNVAPRKEAKAAGFKDPEDKVKQTRKRSLVWVYPVWDWVVSNLVWHCLCSQPFQHLMSVETYGNDVVMDLCP